MKIVFKNWLPALCISIVMPVNSVASEEKHRKIDTEAEQAINAVPNLEKGKKAYRLCAVCHSPEGWGTPSGHYPQIAGQHRSVIVKQLADIHKGNRDNPTMVPFTAPLFAKGTQAMADISAYIEQLPMVPNNSIGSGRELVKGEKLYRENCAECHGDNGEGDGKEYYPRIHGQHYNYLVRQMEWIKWGKRRNADKKMMEQINGFSHGDITAIADYVSRIPPPKALVADHPDWRNPDFHTGFRSAPKSRD